MTSGKIFLLILFWLAIPASLTAAEPLTITYFERPPYYYTNSAGVPAGFLLERTKNAFQEAGIEVNYLSSTPYRIIYILRHALTPTCSIGWFKTAERELFAKFSTPIYRDQSLLLLTSRNRKEQFAKLKTLREVFGDRHLIMARMSEFSYGTFVDRLLGELVPKSRFFTGEQKDLLQAIATGQASYMLVAPEEIDMLTRAAGLPAADFATFKLQDMPAGNLRYLMCNQAVDDSLLFQVNRAIEKLYPDLPAGAEAVPHAAQ